MLKILFNKKILEKNAISHLALLKCLCSFSTTQVSFIFWHCSSVTYPFSIQILIITQILIKISSNAQPLTKISNVAQILTNIKYWLNTYWNLECYLITYKIFKYCSNAHPNFLYCLNTHQRLANFWVLLKYSPIFS